MKTSVKSFLALLMATVMLICVAPLSFAEGEDRHPSYGSVSVGDKENLSHYFNTNNHYYKNDAESCTNDPEGANVSYDQETGIMVLDNFDGGTIRFNDYGDVKIILKGTNTIKGHQFGIYAGYGNLTITSVENAVLNISTSTYDSGAIVTDWNPATDNDITISGNVSVNIETSISSDNDFNGIRAGGKLSIIDNANVSVKGSCDVNYCHIYGLKGASLLLDTTGSVSVETKCVKYYSYALSFNSLDIKNVKEFKIESTGSDRTCIIYNEEAYNSLINTPGFDVSLENDESNYYLTLKHIHKYNDVVTAPTCTEQGYTTHTCECGDVKVDTYVPALGHDFSDNAEVCRRGCGTKNPDYIPPVPAHIHAYTKTVVAPKANAVGYTLNKCACGDSFKSNYTAPTGKPAGLKCTARTAAAMKFTWNKTSGVTGYQVQILNAKGGNAGLKALAGNVYTFTKLAAGHAYKARVRFYIKAADGKNYFGQWTTINSPTLPAGTSLTKVTGAKKAFTAQWKKGACTGYQLQYSTAKAFSGAKTVTIKNAKTLKYVAKKLAAKKTYYVRIRTYKTIGGKNYYSAWSAVKSVTTKAAAAAKKPAVSRNVYITPTGKRYHYDSKCGNGKYIKSTLKEALKKGLTPCKKCVH